MTGHSDKDEKARRLAEQLRANLKRRKAQSREMNAGGAETPDKDVTPEN